MQVKSVGQKKETGGATTTSETLAGFQRYADGLVKQYLEGRLTLSDEVEEAIDTIISYIDKMYGDLWGFHGDDITAAGVFGTEVENCYANTWTKDQHEDKLAKLKSVIEDYALQHIRCRNNLKDQCVGSMTTQFDCSQWTDQHSGIDTRELLSMLQVNGEKVASQSSSHCPEIPVIPEHCAAGVDHCDDYDQYRKDRNGEALLPSCARPPPGQLSDEYIQANEETESTKLEEMEGCLEDMKEWLDPLYAKYECCGRGDDCAPCTVNGGNCQKLQQQFEFEQCLYDTEVGILCSGYDSCFDTVVSNSEADCDKIQIRAKARAADNETAERIKCLLGVLKIDDNATKVAAEGTQSKAEKLSECQADDYTVFNNVWTITCPSGVPEDWASGKKYPAGIECKADRPDMCSVEFYQEHYAPEGLSMNTCTTCPGGKGCDGASLANQVATCRPCGSTKRLNEPSHW